MAERPILMFDSGIGGLTVLREARVLMPDRRFVYVADDAAFPYGDWEEEALHDAHCRAVRRPAGALRPEIAVIPCNTASTLVARRSARQPIPGHPFVGTVPAIKPAAERTRSGLVSVLATPGTVKRQYTRDLIAQWAPKCHVRLVGSTRLARLAEAYMRDGFVDEEAVRPEIAPCFVERDGQRTDIVVLACTHYPFLVNRMRKTAPWPVDWLDPAEAIARRALSLLGDKPASSSARREPLIRATCRLHLRQAGLRHPPADAGFRADRIRNAATCAICQPSEPDLARRPRLAAVIQAKEKSNACKIEGPAEGRRRRAVGQARRHQEERAQGRVEGNVRIDERESSSRSSPRPSARACRRRSPRTDARWRLDAGCFQGPISALKRCAVGCQELPYGVGSRPVSVLTSA